MGAERWCSRCEVSWTGTYLDTCWMCGSADHNVHLKPVVMRQRQESYLPRGER